MQNLNIDQKKHFTMPLQTLIGESVAVLGIKGSGKTNTAAVLIEELLLHGLPLTIVDIEGEYWGLKEKFEILVVGRSSNVDVEVAVEQAAKIAEFSVTHSVSVILDLSDFSQEEMFDFLLHYFKRLWETCFHIRKPYEIVLEEAHEFVPQSVRTPLKEVITRIALRGRKRGLGLISVSQRSAKVEKDVLTQASILFLHRVVHPIDIKIYQEILPLPPKEVERLIGELQSGQALILNHHQVQSVQVRLRHTFHVGATPELASGIFPALRKIDNAMLIELRKLLAQVEPAVDDQTKIIKQLEEQLLQKEQEIQTLRVKMDKLELQVELLSRLQVLVNGASTTIPSMPDLSLNTLEVQQIQTDRLISRSLSEEKNLVVMTEFPHTDEVMTMLPQREIQTLDAQARKKRQKRFSVLVQDVKKLPRFHRLILRFLVEREGTIMNTRDLCRWLDFSERTFQNHPPLDLIKMGLISRSGHRGDYRYASALSNLLRKEFSDLEHEPLIEQLLAAC